MGGGRLFEAGRLLTFSAFRMSAYSRSALIRDWALIQINTVIIIFPAASFPGNNRFRCEAAPLFTPNELEKKKKIMAFTAIRKRKSRIFERKKCKNTQKKYITQWMLPTF